MARKPRISPAVAELMAETPDAVWTLEEIRAGLARRGEQADFSSVFRAVGQLENRHIISRVRLDHGPSRYALAPIAPGHLHCTRCDIVIAIRGAFDCSLLTAAEAQTGSAISGHHILFRGLCADCRRSLDLESAA